MATVDQWVQQFEEKLIQQYGEKKGGVLNKKYSRAFHANYCDENSVDAALKDIEQLEKLSAENLFEVVLYQSSNKQNQGLRLRVYQYAQFIPLSDIVPMLENMDLRTIEELPYEITLREQKIWISDFSVLYTKNTQINIDSIKNIFQEAFTQVRLGLCENDGFNKLVIGAQLSPREIVILRAYAKYLLQTGFRFSQNYIEFTLANYPAIVQELVNLFKNKFDPKQKSLNHNQIANLENSILKKLDEISSLDEDKILRSFLLVIKASLRTNYFLNKSYLSIKFKSSEVPELPLPHPLYEIFVYSPRFEGIHLRSAKVARGGIRWSDRPEDFRTEVLGLMKAQRVKNSVIVPSGAKGGFVVKIPLLQLSNEMKLKEVIACYTLFISGLLDLTDNLKNNKPVRPDNIICYDDFDPYLVVAADKGTATFSDIANGISKEYGFWLGDAFASGGVTGYDHKKMGITARGAWESIKRHFHEIQINIDDAQFTVVGIGDMSGDVFGNGMIYSKNIKLIGAFDHRHIFLDPNPNPKTSYQERLRLFNLPASSWQDYNPKLISAGGGVYKRTDKSIPISPEMKKILNIQANALAPNELIRALLKAPVDLIYNGGIGTYVKASYEKHAEVGDKANELCRVNGNELRCKIVGEGGNLGFTQLGRIEYALIGGLINTDFIDNSAGVDCSDHEVNAKILLNHEVNKDKLTEAKRNQLLADMTNDVASLVLNDNYNQALVLGFSAVNAAKYVILYQSHMKELERIGGLDRAVEFLPDDKTLMERKAGGQGLTRPELAILMAYTKMHIKQELIKSDLLDNAYVSEIVHTAFPSLLNKLYSKQVEEHSLRREIIATQLSNQIVNEMGITFVHRIHTETGANVGDIVRAHLVASQVFNAPNLRKLIESLDFKIPIQLQYELLHHVRHLINLATRWFLGRNRLQGDLAAIVQKYSEQVKQLEKLIPTLMLGNTKNYLDSLTDQFMHAGLSKELAHRIAACRALYITLNVIEVANEKKLDLVKATKVYFAVGGQFNLVWFRDELNTDTREGSWNVLARLTLRDELDVLQKTLTIAIINANKKEEDVCVLFNSWVEKNLMVMDRWKKILELLHSSTSLEYSMFFIALREFSNLIVL
jgi:glutamate dehydrogenase